LPRGGEIDREHDQDAVSDPFEPRSAIHAAASFLTNLEIRSGNPGLAAAYNGGPNRVAAWLAGAACIVRKS
jgi:soluble lytic murein transglycosylase-like protein